MLSFNHTGHCKSVTKGSMTPEAMRTCKGKVMVSINDHPDIRRVFDGFTMRGLDIKYAIGSAYGIVQTSKEQVITKWDVAATGGLF